MVFIMVIAPAAHVVATAPGANGLIAFTSMQGGNYDIFTMKADGSSVTQLTTDAGVDFEPKYSPDGMQIVFRSNRDGNHEIYIMDADGSSEVNLTNNAAGDLHPSVSPDGSQVTFTSNRDGNNEIYVMNIDGTSQTRLTNDPASETAPIFSPDGTKIVFRRGTDIYTMDANGTNDVLLTAGNNPDWAPDGSTILFNVDPGGGFQEIMRINPDGSNLTQLTTNPATDGVPMSSPDGSKIVFRSNRDGNNEIYTMDADGSNQVNISNDVAVDNNPNWQPLSIPPSTVDSSPQIDATSGSIVFDVVANHTDAYGSIDPGSVAVITPPSQGSTSVNPTTGHITFTISSPTTQDQTTSFTYRVCSSASSSLCVVVGVSITLPPIAELAATGHPIYTAIAGFSITGTALALTRFRALHRVDN